MPEKSHHTLSLPVRFWGWSENKREEERDFKELSARARQGLPLYGESPQPEWVQASAYRNSVFSQLKFGVFSVSSASSLMLTSIAQPSFQCKYLSDVRSFRCLIMLPRVNLVHHQHHGVDPAKYKQETDESS